MEMQTYIVYVKVDDQNRIIDVNSSAFLGDVTGWAEIDRGSGYKYRHAQGNFFAKPLWNEKGLYYYKLEDGKPVERTAEEMDADWVEHVPQPDPWERIAALEEQLAAAKILLGVE